MRITRVDEAKPYGAAHHVGVAAPLERIYVVLEGEITVTTEAGDAVLGPLDSCHIAAGEERTVENRANSVAAMLVIMPNPPKEG